MLKFKACARSIQGRRQFIQQEGLLLVGVDVSKSKHDACLGTQAGIMTRKLTFANDREGFDRLEEALRTHLRRIQGRQVLVAMEPSGIYWYGLYHRLRRCGYPVCLVDTKAVSNNRKTMPDGHSKTDPKDARCIHDLLLQGKFFLPVQRDDELAAAYRLLRRHMALKKRISQVRNRLRGALHLSFPELNALIGDLTSPTSIRFLRANPTPEAVLRNGRKRFLSKWKPRRRCGQWRPEKLSRIYELAKRSIGLRDPYRTDEFEIRLLTDDLADAVERAQLWLDKAIELLQHRDDFLRLLQLPRIGKATAAAILCALGNIDEYDNGKQIVKLAGLDIRQFSSGETIHRRPRISHLGSAFLRHWTYFYALRLVAHEPPFTALHLRRKQRSPGKGAGQRALMAVCDKILRIIYRMLANQEDYCPQRDKQLADYYGQNTQVA